MTDYAMIINYKYCTGCHTCEVACRNELGIPVEEWGIKLVESGPKKLEGRWEFNYIPVRSHLCDFCAERLESGKRAACEFHCLAQCMEIVPVDKIQETLARQDGQCAVFTA